MQLIKDEVDALQIATMSNKTPWYKNISTIISITALLLSFGTTFFSWARTEEQDRQNLRTEMRGILQRLIAHTKEITEISYKYPNNNEAIWNVRGAITQESAMLARQAAELATKLPNSYVSATEYFTIAMALQGSYSIDEAKKFLELAATSAKDFGDELATLRARASILYINEKPEAGRVEYQKALDIFSKYTGYNGYVIKATHLHTEISWFYSEAVVGNFEIARLHLDSAENYLKKLTPAPDTENYRKQVEQAKLYFSNYMPPSSP